MLGFNRKTDYALVALAHLAQLAARGDGAVSARLIAERYELPSSLLMNVLKELAQAGIVRSTRGANGGYELAKGPGEVSLLDVIKTLDAPVRTAPCTDVSLLDGPDAACNVVGCPIREPVRRLHSRLIKLFDRFTLADLIDMDQMEASLEGVSLQEPAIHS